MGTTASENRFFDDGDKHEFDPEKWTGNSPSGQPKRAPETNLSILIVGAGLSGLMAALECWRKGHNVIGILERNKGPNYHGDLIIIQPSAIAAFRHYPDMVRELEEDRLTAQTYYYRHDGELVYGPSEPAFNDSEFEKQRQDWPKVGAMQMRKKFYRMLLRQVARIGLKVEYDQRVDRYFEDEAAGLGGVVLQSGEVRTANTIIAADAFKSRSQLLITGVYTKPKPTGVSVYRAAFSSAEAFKDEKVWERWGKGREAHEFWLGQGMHLGVYCSPDTLAFGLTPRNELLPPNSAVAKESWDPDVDPEEVVQVLRSMPGWEPSIEALVRKAPRGNLIHWPLLWRDLQPEWTSKGGHVVQVGDAAHATMPTSTAGGTLAIEDVVTLASCLQLSCFGSGTAGARLGAKIYNLLRHQRVSCTQKMAFVNSQVLNATTDWDAVRADPQSVRLRYPRWLFGHDPEAYAYEKYGQAFAHLLGGAAFHNTNIPPGYTFVPWTIDEVHGDMAQGKRLEELLEGDWS
ncbi:putative monooxygenase [Xylariaceae sp. FL0255]|nr:putative monooxygenase [Xylariaceae sp. FL0255]